MSNYDSLLQPDHLQHPETRASDGTSDNNMSETSRLLTRRQINKTLWLAYLKLYNLTEREVRTEMQTVDEINPLPIEAEIRYYNRKLCEAQDAKTASYWKGEITKKDAIISGLKTTVDVISGDIIPNQDVVFMLQGKEEAFAAGEQAHEQELIEAHEDIRRLEQEIKDQNDEIETLEKVKNESVLKILALEQALAEAEKRGARELLKFLVANNIISGMTGKKDHLGLMVTAEIWQSKLKEINKEE